MKKNSKEKLLYCLMSKTQHRRRTETISVIVKAAFMLIAYLASMTKLLSVNYLFFRGFLLFFFEGRYYRRNKKKKSAESDL